MPWLTEITHVIDHQYFVDEQRKGPYALWHHEHRLIPLDNGIRMFDLVTYQLPAGPLGTIAHRFFVKKQLEGIFSFREETLVERFGRP
jgi:ligand-binding SRPBCC domain-containing protein